MKKLILKLMLIPFVWVLFFSCGNNPENTEEDAMNTAVSADTIKPADSLSVAYQCPMKCEGEKTYAQAGKCPECEMDLEKVK